MAGISESGEQCGAGELKGDERDDEPFATFVDRHDERAEPRDDVGRPTLQRCRLQCSRPAARSCARSEAPVFACIFKRAGVVLRLPSHPPSSTRFTSQFTQATFGTCNSWGTVFYPFVGGTFIQLDGILGSVRIVF